MTSTIEAAIRLRREQKFEQSRRLLEPLLQQPEVASLAHLHIAWSYDNEGKERDAVAHYEAALNGTLGAGDRYEAMFGLASTLRSIGEYERAKRLFEQTLAEYPDADDARTFYAMCLYNLGAHHAAMQTLLDILLRTTASEAIRTYRRAIALYAEDLDRTW